jgi:hypothetical protein
VKIRLCQAERDVFEDITHIHANKTVPDVKTISTFVDFKKHKCASINGETRTAKKAAISAITRILMMTFYFKQTI